MNKTLKYAILTLSVLAYGLLTGCSTIQTALRHTQAIEGTGSVTIETALNLTTASVENARQEDGKFKADRVDIVHLGKWTMTRIEIHGVGYSRKLVD